MKVSLITGYSFKNRQLTKDAQEGFIANSLPSFGAKSLTNLRGIHCPCCGLPMVIMEDFTKVLTEQNLSGTSKKALKAVSIFEASLHHVEKRVFHILNKLGKNNPDATLAQLLIQEAPKHFKSLQIRQLKVLDRIDIYSVALPNDIKAKLAALSNSAREQILSVADTNNINNKYFKRKTFVNSVKELMEANPDNSTLKLIYQSAEKLPNSTNDLDSFIIKYFRRSSREVGQRLVSPSVSTVEHLLPKAKDGENNISNYLPECAHCNGTRHDTLLHKWIQKHPEMLNNIVITVTELICKVKGIRNKLYIDYPKLVVVTIEKETLGNAKNDNTISEDLLKKFQLLSHRLRRLVQDNLN